MSKKIEKPITVVRQEFIDTLVDYINNCGLPLFIMEPILKDMYLEVKAMSQRQYETEKMQYENSLNSNEAQKSNVNIDNA